MKPRLSERSRAAIAAALFAAALGMVLLRVGALSNVGGLRVGAPAAMNDFYSSVYYPVVAFLNGENPHDRLRLKALYPQVEEYPPYLPLNLILYLPFGLLSPKVAAIAYFLFSTVVTLLFSVFVLKLVDVSPRPRRVMLVAGLLLFSRPGHWALISGQHAILLALLTYVSLYHARASPMLSGLALGVCTYKPTYGVPLALLMLASGYLPAVAIGVAIAAAVNTPLLLLLAGRSGGVEPFLQKLLQGYRDWQQLKGMDPGSSLDPMSFNKVHLDAFVSRFLGHHAPAAVSIALTVMVLALASWGLRRLTKHHGRTAEDLSLALICLGMLLAVYHMTYDLVLLTAPLAALVAHGLPNPGLSARNLAFGVLFSVPCLNWALTESALQAWHPSHVGWFAVVSANTSCLVMLFVGYLALALRYPESLATSPVSETPLPEQRPGGVRDRMAGQRAFRGQQK
jgi:hypothetical protein